MNVSNNNIEEYFSRSEKYFNQLFESEEFSNIDQHNINEKLDDAIKITETAISIFKSEALISKNEEIDDISTINLKYLFLEYYLAKFHSNWREVKERISHLKTSKHLFEIFVERCYRMKLIDEIDKIYVDGSNDLTNKQLSQEEIRFNKIARYKNEKEAQLKMQRLKKFLTLSQDDCRELDNEEQIRELLKLRLQSFCRNSLDEISMIDTEIQILMHMSLTQHETKDIKTDSSKIKSNESIPLSSSNGLYITKLTKSADGSIISSREHVKGSVFQPRMSKPTMSLEEYGDLQKSLALSREKDDSNNHNQAQDFNSYEQLCLSGHEDNEELVDQVILKERNWDDWKESSSKNWKGAGNKIGKRF